MDYTAHWISEFSGPCYLMGWIRIREGLRAAAVRLFFLWWEVIHLDKKTQDLLDQLSACMTQEDIEEMRKLLRGRQDAETKQETDQETKD